MLSEKLAPEWLLLWTIKSDKYMKQLFLCTTEQTRQEGKSWKKESYEESLPPFPRLLSEGILLPSTQVSRINTEHVALRGLSKQVLMFIATLVGFVGPSPEEKIAEQSRWQPVLMEVHCGSWDER